jgi:DNA-binding transcriptional regulator YiaG
MPDIKTVLKELVIRLAKQQVNVRLRPLEKKIKESRASERKQKKLIAELQKKVASIAAFTEPKGKINAVTPEVLEKTRLSPTWIAALRRKLKLNGMRFGKILGVSTQTVYKWESGKSKPMQKQRAKIVALRGVGKRKINELLKEVKAG